MKTLRLLVIASFVAVLTGCPNGSGSGAGGGSGGSAGSGTGGQGVGGGTGGSGGSGAGNGGGDAGPPILLADWCQKRAEAVCDKQIACGVLDAPERATCVATVSEQANCPGPRNVMSGNSTFDGVSAAHCFADLAALDCAVVLNEASIPLSLPQACADSIKGGRGTVGAGCTAAAQCQTDAGLYCVFNDFLPCQACGARAGNGAFCAFDVDVRCSTGFQCDEFGTDGGRCRPPGQNGAVCDVVSCATDAGVFCRFATDGGSDFCTAQLATGNGPCTSAVNCQGGNFCQPLPGDGGIRRCDLLRANDQPCTATGQCQPGLYCPTATNRCAMLLADGTNCTTGAECAANYCNRLPLAGADAGTRGCGYLNSTEECWRDNDCGPGKYCRGLVPPNTPDAGAQPGSCNLRDADGGSCTNTVTGASDSCANRAATCLESRCVETPPYSRNLGQSCDAYGQCKSASRCSFANGSVHEGTCIAPFNDGELCEWDEECKKGSFCDYFGSGNCTALVHKGETCDDSNAIYCTNFLTCLDAADGGGQSCVSYSTLNGPCDVFGPYCYGSYCKEDAGVCAARQANGAACADDTECTSIRCANDGGFSGTGAPSTCFMACY